MKKKYFFTGFIALALIALIILLSREKNTANFPTSTRGLPSATSSQIVELNDGDTFNLTASFVKKNIKGNEVRMLAYNGSIPGPTLKIKQGSTITINFKNDTDIMNTIHSHGVRVKNAFDGVPAVTQQGVPPGGSFTYTLTFPDAGMYWYHPHNRDDYAIEMGLYGNFWITPQEGSSWNIVDREVPIFIDDILLEDGITPPFPKTKPTRTLMGRYGNTMFTNGETDYKLAVRKGEIVRFYFTNSANARPFNLSIAGTKMKLVGGDNGLYEYDEWKDSIILAPSERAIVEALFNTPGEYTIENRTPERTYALGKIIVSDGQVAGDASRAFALLHPHPETSQSIDLFRPLFERNPDKFIKLSASMMGNSMNTRRGFSKDGIEWADTVLHKANETSDTTSVDWSIVDQNTGKRDMDIDWKFNVGDHVKIRITNNDTMMYSMQHPIHFHGQRFLVVNKNGATQTNLVWKDTVLVPAGEYVDIVIDMENPGTWMAHCHILEHIEAGMMFTFKVE